MRQPWQRQNGAQPALAFWPVTISALCSENPLPFDQIFRRGFRLGSGVLTGSQPARKHNPRDQTPSHLAATIA